MKKKIGLILFAVFTFLHIVTCVINLIIQHNTDMDTYWLIFPISGNGICYPLFAFTLILIVITVNVCFRKKHVE